MKTKHYKIEVFLPKEYIASVLNDLTKLGACRVGDYDHVASFMEVQGYWKPLEDAKPFGGEKNQINHGQEYKLEVRCPEEVVKQALDRIKEIHPYEEVMINIIPIHNHLFE